MGRNSADFHGVTFSHEPGKYGTVTVYAKHPEHGELGNLQLGSPLSEKGEREVKNLFVEEEHRRKGIATGMWNYAKAQGLNPEHSDSRTPAGDAFAESTGDYVPDNNQMYNPHAPNPFGE